MDKPKIATTYTCHGKPHYYRGYDRHMHGCCGRGECESKAATDWNDEILWEQWHIKFMEWMKSHD